MTSVPKPRTCGSCTLCCKVMGIKDIDKPAGEWCPQCSPGRGCALYPAHPAACREFVCLWLASAEIPDDCRPDRSKVVLLRDVESRRLIAHCDADAPFAWRRGRVYAFLKNTARTTWAAGVRVIAVAASDQWLITPTEDLEMGRIEPGTPYRLRDLPNGDVVLSIRPATGADATLPEIADRVLRRRALR